MDVGDSTVEPFRIFQSTLSMRRATGFLTVDDVRRKISIHALHEESDLTAMSSIHRDTYFNPRSP